MSHGEGVLAIKMKRNILTILQYKVQIAPEQGRALTITIHVINRTPTKANAIGMRIL